ncbi:SdpI/YhfL protein family protein [Propionibacterium cyclohexanicum]|uniref:SdpI/YhfL protein family protein n=1 Tax=Propionibacterium cyclohexanicum TaxID=64702 RepID=A0A1H9TPB0_9ACTN|nr:SdpI family protein [Propionibacterium cyclohexanicum]SER99016.1 SdpI/YhfL protein family protein [Propionibacterium cyclohexanicum]
MAAWAVVSVWTVLGGAGLVKWAGQEANGRVLSVALLGAATAVLGNATPVAPPNAWFGLRVGWSSHSPQVWARSQLVAGRILVGVGTAILVCAFLVPPAVSLVVAVVLLLAAGAVSTLYARHAALAEGPVQEEPAVTAGRWKAAGPDAAGTPDSWPRRAAAIVLAWVPVVVVACYAAWMWGRMPPVIASHWNGLAAPDASQSRVVFLVEAILSSVVFAVFATYGSLSRPTTVRGEQRSVMALGLGSGVAAMITTAYILSVELTIRAGSPERADLGGWTLLVFAAILWGLGPLATQFRGELRYLAHLNWAGVHWP